MERNGDPIPGSKLFRWHCEVCGEPIRVNELDTLSGKPLICSDCDPLHIPPLLCEVLAPRQMAAFSKMMKED